MVPINKMLLYVKKKYIYITPVRTQTLTTQPSLHIRAVLSANAQQIIGT